MLRKDAGGAMFKRYSTANAVFGGKPEGPGVRFRAFQRCSPLKRHAASSDHSHALNRTKTATSGGMNNFDTASN